MEWLYADGFLKRNGIKIELIIAKIVAIKYVSSFTRSVNENFCCKSKRKNEKLKLKIDKIKRNKPYFKMISFIFR